MPFSTSTRDHPSALLWLALALLGPCAAALPAQQADAQAIQITTQERLETEPWWPTMATAPLNHYSGSASCTGCHGDEAGAHLAGLHGKATSMQATGMQRAASRGTDARFLPNAALVAFVSGDLTYALQPSAAGIEYSVSRGHDRVTAELAWVMGAGDLARTFLYKSGDRWFQSETSFYTHPAAMDITTGFGPSNGRALAEALGNVLTPAEARACFNCHTVHATTPAGLDPQHAEPGVGCESCHGPGAQHVAAMQARASAAPGAAAPGLSDAIFDPSKLSPADSIDFCGACHRSFADASLATGPSAGRAVVRFQPYRLEESKCWRATQDERLTCVACHNPHQPLNRVDASYDRNCLQCHSGVATTGATHAAAVCPKATHECVSCHMPKVELPSIHGAFTDHYIRVAKAGEPLPR